MHALYKYTLLAVLLLTSTAHTETKDFKYPSDTKLIIPATKYPANQLTSPHKPIYLMPWHRSEDMGNSTYFKDFRDNRGNKDSLAFNKKEVAFQWGAKLLIATYKAVELYVGYNQESHWQFYTKDPYFRSIDHQLEWFLHYPLCFTQKPIQLRAGYVHRSNGLGLNIAHTDWDKEKAWDRIYVSGRYDFTKASILLKCWHVVLIDRNAWGMPQIGKYNPAIGEFLGYGKLTFIYRFSKNHSITIAKHLFDKLSNYGLSLKSTWEVNYLFPVPYLSLPAVQGIVKGFSGYGKNMITYNAHTFGIGVGIALCFD